MRHAGVTIFLVFFGISVLDALRNGPWLRAVLWLAIGAAFLLMDRVRKGRRRTPA